MLQTKVNSFNFSQKHLCTRIVKKKRKIHVGHHFLTQEIRCKYVNLRVTPYALHTVPPGKVFFY